MWFGKSYSNIIERQISDDPRDYIFIIPYNLLHQNNLQCTWRRLLNETYDDPPAVRLLISYQYFLVVIY